MEYQLSIHYPIGCYKIRICLRVFIKEVQIKTQVYIFLTVEPTRYTNHSNLFLERKSTCFGQFLCPSSGIFHCTYCNGICKV